MRTVFGIEDAERLARLSERLGAMLDIGMQSRALAAIALPPVRTHDRARHLEPLPAPARRGGRRDLRRDRAPPARPPTSSERDDVLSILLQARDEDGVPMTDEELRDELMTLLVAGHETTATTLAWAFDLLLRHPAAARAAAAPRSRPATSDGEYLDAVIKETLRIRPGRARAWCAS